MNKKFLIIAVSVILICAIGSGSVFIYNSFTEARELEHWFDSVLYKINEDKNFSYEEIKEYMSEYDYERLNYRASHIPAEAGEFYYEDERTHLIARVWFNKATITYDYTCYSRDSKTDEDLTGSIGVPVTVELQKIDGIWRVISVDEPA